MARRVLSRLAWVIVAACGPRTCSDPSVGAAPPTAPTSASASASADVADADTGPCAPLHPYDLAAAVKARIASARAQFGPDVAIQVEDDLYVLVDAALGPTFPQVTRLAQKALDGYFHERFSTRPAEAVTVYLFLTHDTYEAYCHKRFPTDPRGVCTSTEGFYWCPTRELLMNLQKGPTTLTHELVHTVVQTDFPNAPAWLDEGLGTLYETPAFDKPGEIKGVTNWRLKGLQADLASNKTRAEVELAALFGMPDDRFRRGDVNEQNRHYAGARYTCMWLEQKGWLWPFYRTWRDGVAGDPTGEKAFTKVVEKTPAEANAEWVEWVKSGCPDVHPPAQAER